MRFGRENLHTYGRDRRFRVRREVVLERWLRFSRCKGGDGTRAKERGREKIDINSRRGIERGSIGMVIQEGNRMDFAIADALCSRFQPQQGEEEEKPLL